MRKVFWMLKGMNFTICILMILYMGDLYMGMGRAKEFITGCNWNVFPTLALSLVVVMVVNVD